MSCLFAGSAKIFTKLGSFQIIRVFECDVTNVFAATSQYLERISKRCSAIKAQVYMMSVDCNVADAFF